ncbi:transglycosylase SLT domain-containing protein [Pleurocapsales cyanobacterium LEGE 10410]|nr:transglycosylase SLT domain-containing protein [Pleurocapsales cyanobacterium LEGE 10410]
MQKSSLRPKQSRQQLNKQQLKRAKGLFLKNKKLVILVLIGSLGWLTWHSQNRIQSRQQEVRVSSLATLRSLPHSARASRLERLARVKQTSHNSQQPSDRHRARYLLASDLIRQKQGKLALTYLQGLESDYPLLRPQIIFKTAQAYQQNNQEKIAQKTLKDLITTYPNHPLTANALLLLDGNRSQYEARSIAEFPTHPQTQQLVRQRLQQNIDQFDLLLLLAKYSRDLDLDPIRDRLVLEYPAQLTSEDWEAIADGYWRSEEHRKAADAYTYAAPTPRNLYRIARGFHRNGNIDSARRAYQRLIREYHDARETGQALLYLASISSGDEAVVYLEKAIAKFPENAPQAYRSKAIVHERFDKHQAAKDSRQKLLNQYGNSTAAAEYRWKIAQKLAANGNKQDAWQWMQPLVKSNREFDFAPKALYWTGKWAIELNNPDAANEAFRKTIKLYPQSYWAWRSAVKLGWNVGDFEQLRSLSPTLDLATAYNPLPMGSKALQELYLLGEYWDAWLLLQSEIEQPQQLTVNEQLTEGLLRLELGQYSEGMQEIWDLTKRDSPQEIQQWKTLRQTSAYWHGLFPFPYQSEILKYTAQEQINPLLVLSVMRKESSFNPEIDSIVGAVGLMQIVPPTAQWVAQQIQLPEYSLTNPKDNIIIGTWYLNHNHHRYNNDSLLAVASYNAGTGNVNAWLNRYDINNRDRFVEQIPFAETKDYVEGVFGNYWNYLRLYNPEIRQKVKQLRQEI